MLQETDLAITPGGRVGDASPLGTKPGPRQLDDYVRMVAHALMREHGFTRSHAIATAKNALKRWRRGGGHVRPQVRAGAAAHLVNQERLDKSRGRGHNLSELQRAEQIDLAFRYRHGWIKINPNDYEHTVTARSTAIEYRGHPIGTARLHPDGSRWLTGFSEHATRHEAVDAITERHRTLVAAAGRRAAKVKRRRDGGVPGLISGRGILEGITAGAFAEQSDRDIQLAIARHAFSEALHPRGPDGKWIKKGTPQYRKAVSAVRAAQRQGNTALAKKILAGKAPPSAAKVHAKRVLAGHQVHTQHRALADDTAFEQHYRAHVARADAKLQHPDTLKLATERTHAHTDERGNIVWNRERQKMQQEVVNNVLREQVKAGAKAQRKALFLGGLPGAGKTRSLDKIDGLNESDYVTINPDIFKAELAKRGLVPKVAGLSPMEASSLAHEESSHMALMLAREARARGLNIIWDITMNKPSSVETRLEPLREAGYNANAVFVDIPHAMSIESVKLRHKGGYRKQISDKSGKHLGERLVPSGHVSAGQSRKGSSSANYDAFQEVKHLFDGFKLYSNAPLPDGTRYPLRELGSGGAFNV